MPEYRRHLPHLLPDAAPVFLTWRLHGSVPSCKGENRQCSGPRWLMDTRVAPLVAEAIMAGEAERNFYSLHAWVIMPNHVHLLITPKIPLAKITRWIKGSTARRANLILGFTGQPFWRDESRDRWMRNEAECRETARYIEENPARAGLVNWKWSSAVKT